MKFQELMERVHARNNKIEEQYGEVLAEDEMESEQLDESVEWWANHMAIKMNEEKAEVEKCKALAAKYTDRAKMFEKRAEWRKEGLFILVSMNDNKPIKVAAGTVYKGKSKATVEILSQVPPEYTTIETVTKTNTAAIELALKGGTELEFAALKEGKEFVAVRV